MNGSFAQLYREHMLLAQLSTQRGARMQIMREWLESDGGARASTWSKFLRACPEAERWFDDDGVPFSMSTEQCAATLRVQRAALSAELAALTVRLQEACPHKWLRHPEADGGWWCEGCGATRTEADAPTQK